MYFLVFHCLNLYSLKCIILLNFRPVLLGVLLQLGALSARLVRLWVNPALAGCSECSNIYNSTRVNSISPKTGGYYSLLLYRFRDRFVWEQNSGTQSIGSTNGEGQGAVGAE